MSRFIKVTELARFKEGVKETAPAYINVDNICYIKENKRYSYRKDGSAIIIDVTELWTPISHITAMEDVQSIMHLIHDQHRR